ncbi:MULTISPECIES: hypothetical protein [Sulfitobacter]|uniref:hypothetical protein n=1 Tax=Sulfitobacter TaxID=60136 RepID=UPI002579F398|nr:hypothetical protein [Sulfitobacter sp. UBA1132]
MTALSKYARLEATGLWRSAPDAQRREVIVSIGDATLVISDLKDQALTHWSLAALARSNPGTRPAIFHPDGDPSETLEIPDSEGEMIDAIETLRRVVERRRPRPGRLRFAGVLTSALVVAAVALFWLPGALQDHTLRVVPKVKRASIGAALLKKIERVSGPACTNARGRTALAKLGARLSSDPMVVLPAMTRPSLHLPGGLIVLNKTLFEDYESPDIAGGYILAEQAKRAVTDPLEHMLATIGIRENFRLLTTGDVSDAALTRYAEHLMAEPAPEPPVDALLARFEKQLLHSTPYAQARDITGETVLPLIEGDPMNGKETDPLLNDADWLRLQNICGG